MLIIDKKEIGLIAACVRLNIPHRVEVLPIGDATNEAATFIAERKGFRDFWSSMVDKRIDYQLRVMYEQYASNRYFFVEVGSLEDLAAERQKDVNWIYSNFGKIENWQCQFREYNGYDDLARKLYSLDQKLGTERVIIDKVVSMYNTSVAERVLAQFPKLGIGKAKGALADMETLEAILADLINNEGRVLKQVHGFGKKIIEYMIEELKRVHEYS